MADTHRDHNFPVEDREDPNPVERYRGKINNISGGNPCTCKRLKSKNHRRFRTPNDEGNRPHAARQ